MITTSLIDNIDEMSIIVEINHHLTAESNFIEMNFAINRMINFNLIVDLKSALYVTNSIVDQSIIQIKSERTRKSVSSMIFLSLKTIIVFSSIFANMRAQTRLTIMMR